MKREQSVVVWLVGGRLGCLVLQVAVSAVVAAWEPQEKDEEVTEEEHESLVHAHREAAAAALDALASHPSMSMEDAVGF